MVHLIVGLLKDSGHSPVIAMRGYGAKPGEKGDEQREHELTSPGVPIVAQPDRAGGLRRLFATPQGAAIDCVVLDDGFQHRKIARDLDIVLIDATRPPQGDALLPKGHLREPTGSLARAGLVVLTHCERLEAAQIQQLRAVISTHINDGTPLIESRHCWARCLIYDNGPHGWQCRQHTVDALHARSVHLVSGIGNASAFEQMARSHGALIHKRIQLKDHESISQALLHELFLNDGAQEQPDILMTRKDWVKVRDALAWPIAARVLVPELTLELADPMIAVLRTHLNSVFSA